jgi:hypothetical protein
MRGFSPALTPQRIGAGLLPRDSIVTIFFSEQSGFPTLARMVINDSSLYVAIWRRIAGADEVPPAIDFTRYQVILAAHGPTASLDTQILIDTVETRGVVRVWTISLGSCLTASAYGSPVHLVRIPRAIDVRRFDDRARTAKYCELPVRIRQLRWLRMIQPQR